MMPVKGLGARQVVWLMGKYEEWWVNVVSGRVVSRQPGCDGSRLSMEGRSKFSSKHLQFVCLNFGWAQCIVFSTCIFVPAAPSLGRRGWGISNNEAPLNHLIERAVTSKAQGGDSRLQARGQTPAPCSSASSPSWHSKRREILPKIQPCLPSQLSSGTEEENKRVSIISPSSFLACNRVF